MMTKKNILMHPFFFENIKNKDGVQLCLSRHDPLFLEDVSLALAKKMSDELNFEIHFDVNHAIDKSGTHYFLYHFKDNADYFFSFFELESNIIEDIRKTVVNLPGYGSFCVTNPMSLDTLDTLPSFIVDYQGHKEVNRKNYFYQNQLKNNISVDLEIDIFLDDQNILLKSVSSETLFPEKTIPLFSRDIQLFFQESAAYSDWVACCRKFKKNSLALMQTEASFHAQQSYIALREKNILSSLIASEHCETQDGETQDFNMRPVL